jgi:hypothetical protein
VATKRLRGAPDLKGAMVAVLLAGWGAVAPDPGPHGFGGGFVVLCEPGGAERLWAEHLACGFDEPDGDDDDEDDE